VKLPPRPPPVEVIVEKTELEPEVDGPDPGPPDPTVIGYAVPKPTEKLEAVLKPPAPPPPAPPYCAAAGTTIEPPPPPPPTTR
jgi:hypothetical protein